MRAFERATSPERLAEMALILLPDEFEVHHGTHTAEKVFVYKIPGAFL